MKFFNLILVLMFPIVSYADGVKVSEFTLETVRMALLVKVLMYNARKGIAKVEILKKYSKLKEPVTVPGEKKLRPPPPASIRNSTSDAATEEVFDFQSVQSGQIVSVNIKAPVKMVANKWVQDIRYWNQLDSIADNTRSILVDEGSTFVFSPDSPQLEEKFDLLFNQELLTKKISQSTTADLKILIKDRDFENIGIDELAKRNAIDANLVLNIADAGAMNRVLHRFLSAQNEEARSKMWLSLAMLKANSDVENQRQFLQTFYYSEPKPFDLKVSVYKLFKQSNKELQPQFSLLLYEARELFKKQDYSVLPKVTDFYLDYLKYIKSFPGEFRTTDFSAHLPEKEKNEFLERFAIQFVEYNQQNSDIGVYQFIIDELKTTENLKIAWILSGLDFKKLHSSIEETLFNLILKILFQKADTSKPEIKSKIFRFCEPYLSEAKYPLKLSPEVKEKYLAYGGIIYEDLLSLRLSEQKNLPELAAKFTYYFEKALRIEVLELKNTQNKSTIKIKVLKNLGSFKEVEKDRTYPNVLGIGKADQGQTLFLAIDNESVLLLEKMKLKTMYLAAKASSYQFLVFDPSFEKQIEGSFK